MRAATRFCAALCVAAPLAAAGSSLRANAEVLELPGGESMGWVGAELLFDIGGSWLAGPAVYGAASGQRGGLFVGGLSLRRRWTLTDDVSVEAGLLAASGGGADAPVGGGRMWRPSLSLFAAVSPVLDAGLTRSWVDFPDGQIRSAQWGLGLAWHAPRAAPSSAGELAPRAPWSVDQVQATAGQYRFTDGSGRQMGLVGARLGMLPNHDSWAWGIEADAAVSGDAAGYMAILGTLDFGRAVAPATRVALRLGAGLGGGGAVPTSGGALAKAAVLIETRLTPRWVAGVSLGQLHALEGPFGARAVQAWVGLDLDAPGAEASAAGTDVALTLRRYSRVERHAGGSRSVDTVGLKLAHALDAHWYLGGEANSAFAGEAGAFGIGLLGLGWSTDTRRREGDWQAGVELMGGAAGGGGVAAAGGAVLQALAWADHAGPGQGHLRVGFGRARSLRSGFASALMELAWTRPFGP